MANISWIKTGFSIDDWNTAADWSTGTVPGPGDDVTVATDYGAEVTTPISIQSLILGPTTTMFRQRLIFTSAGASSISTGVSNYGGIELDGNSGDGGSTLTIGGTLTNGNSGYLSIGNLGLSASSTVTAAAIDNTGTDSGVFLSGSSNKQATLRITGAAGFGTAGVVTGRVGLQDDALIEFSSGQIATIAAGSFLGLFGSGARVADASDTTTNSALVGLTNILGEFILDTGALSTNAALSNAGNLSIYNSAFTTGGALRNSGVLIVDAYQNDGGSKLTIGGPLINTGKIFLGSYDFTSTYQAPSTITATGLDNTGGEIDLVGDSGHWVTLDVAGAAGFGRTGVLIGNVDLRGNALVKFSSGQITSIAGGASLRLLEGARIADASDTTTNSALTGLVSNAGTFTSSTTVRTAGAFSNSGAVQIEDSYFYSAALAVGGKLTNSGRLDLYGRSYVGGSAQVDAATLSNTGTISVTGYYSNGVTTNANALAKLAIAGVTGGTGSIRLTGNALVELGGAVGAGQTIAFNPPLDSFDAGGSALVLKTPGSFAGAITGFGANDTLDLAGETVTGFAYAGSTLTLTLAGGAKQTFNFSGTFGNLRTADDGSGGTAIVGVSNQFTLTTGSDIVDFIQGANTVNGRAATLNPGDSLTGGSGIDTLALTGGGTFDVAALAKFTGFERVTLDNTNSTVLKLRAGAPVAATGGIRNNKYYVANAGDLISDPAGRDQVLASVTYALQAGQAIEKLSTANSSGTGAINLTGNELADAIIGNAGANVLNGRAGNDTLSGLGGHDTFVFSTALDASSNVDTITDFATTAANPIAHDMIALSDAIFAAVGPAGGLAGSAFHVGAGASDADQRIIYDGATGSVFYDSDGSGAAAQTQFARLTPGLAMTSADFKIV